MNKKVAGILAAAMLMGMVLTVMVCLIVGVLGWCTKVIGAPATVACMAAGIAFTGFCLALLKEEGDEDG